jgi:mevalonate kinase
VSIERAASGTGRAPGKVILLGEHAVVYNRPALAAAIDRYVEVRVCQDGTGGARAVDPIPQPVITRAAQLSGLAAHTLAVTATADLPIGVGLGSSAALSVALVRALADYAGSPLDDTVTCARAFELEKLFHGFPSGIDNTVSACGGVLRFERGRRVAAIVIDRPLSLVVAVGRTPRATRRTVTALRRRWEADPGAHEAIFDAIAGLVDAGETAVARGDLRELGRLMNANHDLLHRLGVSTDELEHMLALARTRGALGAKLTGGGGGGAIICLCPDTPARLITAFARAGWHAFVTEIGDAERGAHAIASDDVERFNARI